MTQHSLAATPQTVRIGQFDATFAPVLTIEPGDTVSVQCVSGRPGVLPPAGSDLLVPEALAAILAANPNPPAGHIVTGPIAVAGAEPGDTLEIRIDAIEPGANWGYNVIRPLAGTLPEDFHETVLMHIPVDKARGVCTLPWGTELTLAPFFGVMGVAPPPAMGTLASKEPRLHGGNLDNKELMAGSSLFLPVWVPGANFLRRRWARRARRWRGVRDRAGDVPEWRVHLHPAQEDRPEIPARGDADPLDQHGHA